MSTVPAMYEPVPQPAGPGEAALGTEIESAASTSADERK